ncbi:MAG TPA: ABC transporter permease [Candidatus Angelobacter sp.]|nr:ABC transporter permease [Candidatus Angelobacter sp.]
MIRYLLRRFGHGLLLLFVVSILLFLVQQAAPGEFLTEMRLNSQISEQTLQGLREQYGLDKPLPVRYAKWARSVAGGDFGYSFAYNLPVSGLVWPRVRNTLLLTVPALLISWMIALPLGVLAAGRRYGWAERLFSGSTSVLLAFPDILLGLLALLIALRTGLFPIGGMSSIGQAQGHASLSDLLWHLTLPVLVLVIGSVAPILRQVRSSILEVTSSSYYRAAEGNGLRPLTLLFRHALPAAVNPLVSLFGLSVAYLLSTSLVVEVVMGWPGLGPMLLEAVLGRDLFVVLGAVMFTTFFLVAGNLIADVLLYVFDPRIRMEA